MMIRSKFPGGEIHVKLTPDFYPEGVKLRADLRCSDDIMALLLQTDAYRRMGVHSISVEIPYLPYARQDRACNPGEALSLKVMCDIINAQNYKSVTIWDVHSDVALALLNNVINIPLSHFLMKIDNKDLIVAPDAGALKKISRLKLPFIRADKERCTVTGKITNTVVYSGDLGNTDLLIVDDICDGGRTFIELAKELKKITTGKINLYVTHGIFSNGFDIFRGLIDKIYCPNPFVDIPEDFK